MRLIKTSRLFRFGVSCELGLGQSESESSIWVESNDVMGKQYYPFPSMHPHKDRASCQVP